MKVRIEIDTKTFVRFWLVVIGFAFAILALYLSRTALVIIASALFLALALSTPVNALRKYIPGRSRIAATALAFIVVLTFLGGFVFLVAPPIVSQTVKLADSAPRMVSGFADQRQVIGDFINEYQLQPQIDTALRNVRDESTRLFSSFTAGILTGVGSLFAAIGAVLITLVLSFLILIEGPRWLKTLWNLYDDEDVMQHHKKVFSKMHQVITGYVTGQLTVSGIGGVATGVMVFVLSLFFVTVASELALPALAIAFVLSLIPMFGATIGGALITLLLLINSLPAAIIFLVYFIVYQQIENNLIAPTIQSRYLELSPLTVLVAVTVGLYLFGLAGGIISIPIAGIIKVLLEEYLEKRYSLRKKNQQPISKLVKKLQSED